MQPCLQTAKLNSDSVKVLMHLNVLVAKKNIEVRDDNQDQSAYTHTHTNLYSQTCSSAVAPLVSHGPPIETFDGPYYTTSSLGGL